MVKQRADSRELEMEQSTSSMSKGCFLFNPGSLQPPPSKKKKQKKVPTSPSHFIPLPLESGKDAEKRYQAFLSCWSKLREKIEVVVAKQHDQVFANLLGFITTSTHRLSKLHQDSISKETFRPPKLEVPTAVLVAGVNMPDHDVLFRQLRVMIRNVISPHVVLLKSSNCSTGMKATMKEILAQLCNEDTKAGQSSDMDESQSLPHMRPSLRLPLCSMDILSGWYQESCDTMQDHMTTNTNTVHRPPVVVIVEDFEAFSPPVLQDLVASVSSHLPEFPVVLVLGVATSVRAVHCSLSRSASSLLCLEVFHTQHSTLTLEQITTECLMNTFPVKLDASVFSFLLHQFFFCNFSLVNFTTGLKFAVMDHFYWQPLSVILSSWLETGNWDKKLKLNHAQCEAIRATPSFQEFVLIQSPDKRVLLLEDDNAIEPVVHDFMKKLDVHHKTFFPLLECLHIFTRDLPNSPLGSKRYDLYLFSLECDIIDHPRFLHAWSFVKLMSREDLSAHLTECIRLLESYHDENLSQYLEQFNSFIAQLGEHQEQPMDTGGHQEQPMDTGESGQSVQPPPAYETTSERKMRLEERLKQVSSGKKLAPSASEILKGVIVESLKIIFVENLLSPSSLPLHEVMYFSNVSSLRKQLAPAPRAALQTALSTPHYYLPSAGHVTEESGLWMDRNMPDVCIVYQLHLECGRLINLYDWLQAFVAVVGRPSEERKESSSHDEIDSGLHARFIQAVSELQFLGFIKPTQRKTDHVQRLTWGAC